MDGIAKIGWDPKDWMGYQRLDGIPKIGLDTKDWMGFLGLGVDWIFQKMSDWASHGSK